MALTPVFSRYLRWILGSLALLGIAFLAYRASEQWPQVRQLRLVRPWMLAGALVFQAGNSLSDVWLWGAVLRRGRAEERASMGSLLRLSFFVQTANQVLPSGGASGTVAVVQGLERRGVSRSTALAAVVVTVGSFIAAFGLWAALSLFFVAGSRIDGAWMIAAGAVGAAVLAWVFRRTAARVIAWVEGKLGAVDWTLLRSPSLWIEAVGFQLFAFAVDVGTLWFLVAACSQPVSLAASCVALMAGSLARTVVPLFHGLGASEAATAFSLYGAGVAVPEAMAVALLFRVVRFWLPILPGLWVSRTELKPGRLGPAIAANELSRSP